MGDNVATASVNIALGIRGNIANVASFVLMGISRSLRRGFHDHVDRYLDLNWYVPQYRPSDLTGLQRGILIIAVTLLYLQTRLFALP